MLLGFLTLVLLSWQASCEFDNLVFADEFDTLDPTRWKHEITMNGGMNWEFELFTNNRTNSYIRNGSLFIRPSLTEDWLGAEKLNAGTLDMWGSNPGDACTSNQDWGCARQGGGILPPIMSAKLTTADSFAFQYGRLEVRAKMPRLAWSWPAIWLMPRYNAYGGWPASGEIDVMETRGNGPEYPGGGNNRVSSALHQGPFWPEDDFRQSYGEKLLPTGHDYTTDYHVYGLVKTNHTIFTYLDSPDNKIMEIKVGDGFWKRGGWDQRQGLANPWVGAGADAPFDQPFYIIIQVAIGGVSGFWDDSVPGKPWQDKSKNSASQFWDARDRWLPGWKAAGESAAALQVDWVRVYQ